MAFTEEQQLGLLEEIAEITNALTPRGKIKEISGDNLSVMGVRLAALKAAIVDLKVDAEQNMLTAEVAKDQAKAQAYAKYKKTDGATAAGDMKNADPDYIKARDEYNAYVVNFNRLKSILSNTHDLIESITGRMIELHGARKDERLG